MKREVKNKKNSISAVRILRNRKLKQGLPFMIHVKELSSKECYYEFPDGKIELVTISTANEISTLKVLSAKEAKDLREKLNLENVL